MAPECSNSRDALALSEQRLIESRQVRSEASREFEALRHNLKENHFANSIRAILTGGKDAG